jgi:hypothetical protein
MENEKNSLLAEKNIEIQMCTGDGWYPFVMTFNADEGFQRFAGDYNKRLTILYNFPKFDLKKGCSKIYDNTSPYYNGFYGAYAVNGLYGFDSQGNIEEKVISQVPKYDFTKLVLRDLGLKSGEEVFSWDIVEVKENIKLAGYDGWTCIDADMVVNGVLHTKTEFVQNYIQYGVPAYECSEDFVPVDMVGRVYAKYFKDSDITVFFYIIVRDYELLEATDNNIISQSKIIMKKE